MEGGGVIVNVFLLYISKYFIKFISLKQIIIYIFILRIFKKLGKLHTEKISQSE